MKFQIGDKVKVCADLTIGKQYSMEDGTTNRFVKGMEPFIGQTATISYAASYGYNIEGSPWMWSDEMFEFSALE